MRFTRRSSVLEETVRWTALRRGEALEHERFGMNSPVDCSLRISHAEHRNSRNGWFGAQSEEADRNTGLFRRESTVRSGEVPAFGRLKGGNAASRKALYKSSITRKESSVWN